MENKLFTAKQLKVLKQADRRWNILYGATRSGKTHVSYFLIPLRIKEHWNNNVLFVGKTINTIDRNVFDVMRRLFGEENISKIIDKKHIYVFGKKCYVVGANDERAITKIQGMGIGYAYCDELTTYPENFFQMLKSRLDRANSKCDATCNPEAPNHFVKQHIDKKELDIYSEQFTLYDNDFLSREFITALENEYKGTIYYDMWVLGNWVKAEGLVYPLFKRERHFLTYEQFERLYGRRKIRLVIFGGDGATTNDATTLVPIAVLDNEQSVVLDIFYHDPKVNGQLSNEELMIPIEKYLKDIDTKYKLSEQGVERYAYIDCAAADLVLTFRYHFGGLIKTEKWSHKDIKGTTDVVNNALARNASIILNFGGYYNYIKGRWESALNPLVKELESMVWDPNNNNYDDTVPNDTADGYRYGINAYYANPDNLWSVVEGYYKEDKNGL